MAGVQTFSTRQSSLGDSSSPGVVVRRPGSPACRQIQPNFTASFTPWGELACALGGRAGYERVRASDEQRTAPGAETIAELFNGEPSGVVFGQNMTSLTFAVSRALSAGWSRGDSVVLTELDHDANYTPWHRAAEERGAEVRMPRLDKATGCLPVQSVTDLLDESVRLARKERHEEWESEQHSESDTWETARDQGSGDFDIVEFFADF